MVLIIYLQLLFAFSFRKDISFTILLMRDCLSIMLPSLAPTRASVSCTCSDKVDSDCTFFVNELCIRHISDIYRTFFLFMWLVSSSFESRLAFMRDLSVGFSCSVAIFTVWESSCSPFKVIAKVFTLKLSGAKWVKMTLKSLLSGFHLEHWLLITNLRWMHYVTPVYIMIFKGIFFKVY